MHSRAYHQDRQLLQLEGMHDTECRMKQAVRLQSALQIAGTRVLGLILTSRQPAGLRAACYARLRLTCTYSLLYAISQAYLNNIYDACSPKKQLFGTADTRFATARALEAVPDFRYESALEAPPKQQNSRPNFQRPCCYQNSMIITRAVKAKNAIHLKSQSRALTAALAVASICRKL